MSALRILYLLLAVAGIALTWTFNMQFVAESGGSFDIGKFLADSSSNAASKSLTWDLGIACVAGLVWIFVEMRRLRMRFFWIYVVLTFGVAYAFAFPLFLFMRQGKLESLEGASSS